MAWVVCLLMGMGGLVEIIENNSLRVDGYGWIAC
jgi:hypothetical protein